MVRLIGCVTEQHDLRLVLVAAGICCLSCFTAVSMLDRARSHAATAHLAWLAGAGLVFGSGVWATHFLGMLAFVTSLVIGYEPGRTMVSFALVCSGATAAFWLVLRAQRHGGARMAAALLFGGSIGAMHYLGISGMRVHGTYWLAWEYVVASITISSLLSYMAFWVLRSTWTRTCSVAAAGLLSLAVVVLHFTGMAGLTIEPSAVDAPTGLLVSSTLLITMVSAVSVMILGFSLVGSIVDQHLSWRASREASNLHHLAHHDTLTALPNRLQCHERLAFMTQGDGQDKPNIAVLCLDLDRFKQVNDVLGHAAGDLLLVQVAGRLKSLVRSTDMVARMGGDEFVVAISRPVMFEAAATLASRLIDALGEPFWLDGQQVTIGTSVGIALSPTDGATSSELLQNADTALYQAKRDGRGLYRFFDASMGARLRQRQLLEQDLRRGIHENQLELHYQPLLNVGSKSVAGFEALVRWQHPQRGLLSPAEFISVAEESGLILPLGRWVLATACREAASWELPLQIAVNLSPVQFRQPDLAETIIHILNETGLAPERLELEVTEGVLIQHAEQVIEILNKLRNFGVGIALDDFGTGYSSLSYLRRFPFNKMKLDRSFIQALGDDQDAGLITRAILELGRSLRLTVTAEGVETDEQLRFLETAECNQVQGYLVGRPLPRAAIATLTRSDTVKAIEESPAGLELPAAVPVSETLP